eukprot:11226763-Lingulodinium_polyedra.AAC.1
MSPWVLVVLLVLVFLCGYHRGRLASQEQPEEAEEVAYEPPPPAAAAPRRQRGACSHYVPDVVYKTPHG